MKVNLFCQRGVSSARIVGVEGIKQTWLMRCQNVSGKRPWHLETFTLGIIKRYIVICVIYYISCMCIFLLIVHHICSHDSGLNINFLTSYVSWNITFKKNLDIRGSRILPRFNKLRTDGDTGIANKIKILGKHFNRADTGRYTRTVRENRGTVSTMVNRCATISNTL